MTATLKKESNIVKTIARRRHRDAYGGLITVEDPSYDRKVEWLKKNVQIAVTASYYVDEENSLCVQVEAELNTWFLHKYHFEP